MGMVGCGSCIPATSWAGPKHTNLLMFPGFYVKKIKANRTKETLTRCCVFTFGVRKIPTCAVGLVCSVI